MSRWIEIKQIDNCKTITSPVGGEMFKFPVPNLETSFWLIGDYRDLTTFATKLRNSEELQEFVSDEQIRFGFRKTDVPPKGIKQQKRYGNTLPGSNRNADFTHQRNLKLSKPVLEGTHSANRISDREENVRTYWASKTPEAHHIVEFNHLSTIGVSKRDGINKMDRDFLPCVLLFPEFHQRWISSILKQTHHYSNEKLEKGLRGIYSQLYTDRALALKPLWKVSEVILRAAARMLHNRKHIPVAQ